MSNRNKLVGSNAERKIYKLLNRRILSSQKGVEITKAEMSDDELSKIADSAFILLPKLGSTRRLSRDMDKRKKDITPENMDRLKEFPYIIQSKSEAKKSVDYSVYLKEIVDNNTWGIPVVFHEQTKKTGEKFVKQGDFALMYRSDFIDMMFEIAELRFQLKQKEHFEK
jgi:hypothetical protein